MADFTIIGGGLAGCSLAWALLERGKTALLIDRGERDTSSQVAAGIVNPITGPKLTKTWRFEKLWPAVLDFYRYVEYQSDATLFHHMPLVRLLHSEEQRDRWQKRLRTPGYAECLTVGGFEVDDCFTNDFGGFEMDRAGYLDIPAFIAATREMLSQAWIEGEGGRDHEGVTIYCEGVAGRDNELFKGVTFKPAKGEILDLRIAGVPEDRIINRGGVWLLPLGEGRFRAGSTYNWDQLDTETTPAGRATIEERLGKLLSVPFEVLAQRAAVRPVIAGCKLLLGLHPERDDLGFFNGLGSKGVLSVPLYARQFAAALCGEGSIDPEVDLREVSGSSE